APLGGRGVTGYLPLFWHHGVRLILRRLPQEGAIWPGSNLCTLKANCLDRLHMVRQREGCGDGGPDATSPDSLPPIGISSPTNRRGATRWAQRPRRVSVICACGKPPVLRSVTRPSSPRPAPQPRSRNALGISGRRSPEGTGPPSCCSCITPHRRPRKAPRPS